jgi:hypothetical protein
MSVEYCKLIHSVNSEKKRNMEAINDATREMMHELLEMKKKLIGDDKIRKYVDS